MSDVNLHEMDPANVAEPYSETQFTHFDGRTRKVYYNDDEVPFPEGKLIVSRTDTNGLITHFNQAFMDMSGYDSDELMGAPHYILRHPDMPAAAYADMWNTLQAGNKWSGYVKNLRKDGRFYCVFAVIIPNVRDGKVVGYASVRRKPSRTKMDEALKNYASMQSQGVPTS